MYLLYVDASGTPESQDSNSRHYVLVGLCVHEGTWFALDKRLNGLKAAYCPPGRDFELHAAQFAGSIREQDEIPAFADMSWTDRRARVAALQQAKIAAAPTASERRNRAKKYKRTEPFIHLTRQERSQLLEDALDLVGAHRGISLFGEAIRKTHPAVMSRNVDPVHQAFEQVVSRFDAFLKRLDDWKLQKSPRRLIDNGLLVLDQDYTTEATILSQFRDYRRKGLPGASGPLDADSNMKPARQHGQSLWPFALARCQRAFFLYRGHRPRWRAACDHARSGSTTRAGWPLVSCCWRPLLW
ncbi:MAG TPA: DUF3800 domain-containing protein [Pirellulales bacterium]